MKKRLPSVEHVETLFLVAMRCLVGGLVEELHALKAEIATLRSENEALREGNAQLRLDKASLKSENQQPSSQLITGFRRKFDKIFARRTGYAELDKLLLRLHRRG
jgi:regulator of replication initiation timing